MSLQLASDADNPNFVGAHNPDAALVVKFYTKAVHQPYQSTQENRPIYADVDYIQIFTPGNQLNIIDTPVRGEHQARFAQQWAAYKAGRSAEGMNGTPVNQWPFLSAAQAEEFRAIKFFTVEQLANASDGQLQNLGMVGGMNPHSIRERAKAFLAAAAGSAPTERLAQENEELKQQMADLQRQMQALAANTGAVVALETPKRKRRTKAEMEADTATNVTPPPNPEPQHEPVRI